MTEPDTTGRYVGSVRLEILLLAADPGARDLVLRFLDRHRVTVAASPEEAALLLAARRYSFVLTTNFGVPAGEAIAVVPAERDFPVLFLTGHVTDRIEKECAEKSIPSLRVPEALDVLRGMLRLALEGSEDLRTVGWTVTPSVTPSL